MKTIIICTLLLVLAILCIPVYSLPAQGTNVGWQICPTDSGDVYATHNSVWGKGGWREVADTLERNAISDLRRTEGMVVACKLDSSEYMLKKGITNSHWIRLPKYNYLGINGGMTRLLFINQQGLIDTSKLMSVYVAGVINKFISPQFNWFYDTLQLDDVLLFSQATNVPTWQSTHNGDARIFVTKTSSGGSTYPFNTGSHWVFCGNSSSVQKDILFYNGYNHTLMFKLRDTVAVEIFKDLKLKNVPVTTTASHIYGRRSTDTAVVSLTPADVLTLIGAEPTIAAGTNEQYRRGDESWQTLNVAAVAGAQDSLTALHSLIDGKEPAIAGGTVAQFLNGLKQWVMLQISSISGLQAALDAKFDKLFFSDSLDVNMGNDNYLQMASGKKLVNSYQYQNATEGKINKSFTVDCNDKLDTFFVTREANRTQGLAVTAGDRELYMIYKEDVGEPTPGNWNFINRLEGGISYLWMSHNGENNHLQMYADSVLLDGNTKVDGIFKVQGTAHAITTSAAGNAIQFLRDGANYIQAIAGSASILVLEGYQYVSVRLNGDSKLDILNGVTKVFAQYINRSGTASKGLFFEPDDDVVVTDTTKSRVLQSSSLTPARVVVTDANKNIISSTITAATLAFLDITSSLQALLNNKLDLHGKADRTDTLGTHRYTYYDTLGIDRVNGKLDAIRFLDSLMVWIHGAAGRVPLFLNATELGSSWLRQSSDTIINDENLKVLGTSHLIDNVFLGKDGYITYDLTVGKNFFEDKDENFRAIQLGGGGILYGTNPGHTWPTLMLLNNYSRSSAGSYVRTDADPTVGIVMSIGRGYLTANATGSAGGVFTPFIAFEWTPDGTITHGTDSIPGNVRIGGNVHLPGIWLSDGAIEANHIESYDLGTTKIATDSIYIQEWSSPCTLWNNGNKGVGTAYKQLTGNFVKISIPYFYTGNVSTGYPLSFKFDDGFINAQVTFDANVRAHVVWDGSAYRTVMLSLYGNTTNEIRVDWGSLLSGPLYFYSYVFDYRKEP